MDARIKESEVRHYLSLVNNRYLSKTATNNDLDLVFEPPRISFENYMSDNYPDYASMTELPEEVINNILSSEVTSYKHAFDGCAALSQLPYYFGVIQGEIKGYEYIRIDTKNAKDISYMFKDCTSLPEEFPLLISCKSIENKEGIITISNSLPCDL